jgi:hypothetical protein
LYGCGGLVVLRHTRFRDNRTAITATLTSLEHRNGLCRKSRKSRKS